MAAAYDDFGWTSERELRQMAAGAKPWKYYLDTVVHFASESLTGTVVPVETPPDSDTPPWGSLHVVSAVQPGTDPESLDNAARLKVLDDELFRLGLQAVPAIGAGIDSDYKEDSRAVFGLDDSSAQALGLRFGQVAVFGWRGPIWSLMACASTRRTDRSWRWIAGP